MSGFTNGYDALYETAETLKKRRAFIAGDGYLEAQTAIDAAIRVIDLLMAGLLVAENRAEERQNSGAPPDRP